MMDRISLDVDTSSSRTLLWTWFRAKARHPESKITVNQSLSGLGYHIKIHKKCTPLENIMERAIIGDDGWRLMYSIRRWALCGEEFIDICHNTNGKEDVLEVDMNQLLKKHSEDVDYVLKNIYKNPLKAGDKVGKMAEEIKPKLKKLQKEYFVTCIGFNGDDLYAKIKKIAEDTSEKDKSFKWRLFESFFPKYDYLFTIISKNKDQAYQRGEWMKRVVKKEFDIDIYYWIKKKINK